MEIEPGLLRFSPTVTGYLEMSVLEGASDSVEGTERSWAFIYFENCFSVNV